MDRSIVLALHPHREAARRAALTVATMLQREGITPVMLAGEHAALISYTGPIDTHIHVVPDDYMSGTHGDSELVMVLGGDGTMLRAARHFHTSQVPIMGINLGHIGFLAESERKDLKTAVHRAANREYTVEARMAVDITVSHGDEVIHQDWALNEVTLEKNRETAMIEVVVGVDARPVSSFGCDGVILATPTGSTAYAFSAGGPIVWPEVEALLMVPISAHALFAKPLVVSPSSRLGVEYLDRRPAVRASLWCDGTHTFDVQPGSRLEAVRSAAPVHFARLNLGPFTDRLVGKFQLPVAGWRGPQDAA
ncbi:NAD kinase [Brevibacterium sp. 50QC2O2]|uniref:NAD kinase n=1 Tax=Brevibacterium TaxID=1696 RepID=UPI00211C1710|nr:NAD kinase [Brevibacterium sp. 68QC2CO]MCQ9388281.1 NAD kinase [Brevibacterium sp. 50QC2O2]